MAYERQSETLQDEHGERLRIVNHVTPDGRPAGGIAAGIGLRVDFQDGPIGESGRNGAFIEDLLKVVIHRLEFYQSGEFECDENRLALRYANSALRKLEARTADRKERGVEGTYEA